MSSKLKLIIRIAILFLIFLGSSIALATVVSQKNRDSQDVMLQDDNKKPYNVDGNKEEGDITNQAAEAKQNQELRCIISSAPYFKAATKMGSFCIANHEDNKGYLLQVEITEIETGDAMYISPLLKPGEKIQEDYLKKKTYENGEYPAIATFNFYTEDDQSFYYSIPFRITINIGN